MLSLESVVLPSKLSIKVPVSPRPPCNLNEAERARSESVLPKRSPPRTHVQASRQTSWCNGWKDGSRQGGIRHTQACTQIGRNSVCVERYGNKQREKQIYMLARGKGREKFADTELLGHPDREMMTAVDINKKWRQRH